MIRPITIVCGVLALGSCLYLYHAKHEVEVMDKKIEQIAKETASIRAESRHYLDQWIGLGEPEQLRKYSDQYLGLKSVGPTQFLRFSDLADRLPAPQAPEQIEARQAAGGTDEETDEADADDMPIPPIPPTLVASEPAPSIVPAVQMMPVVPKPHLTEEQRLAQQKPEEPRPLLPPKIAALRQLAPVVPPTPAQPALAPQVAQIPLTPRPAEVRRDLAPAAAQPFQTPQLAQAPRPPEPRREALPQLPPQRVQAYAAPLPPPAMARPALAQGSLLGMSHGPVPMPLPAPMPVSATWPGR